MMRATLPNNIALFFFTAIDSLMAEVRVDWLLRDISNTKSVFTSYCYQVYRTLCLPYVAHSIGCRACILIALRFPRVESPIRLRCSLPPWVRSGFVWHTAFPGLNPDPSGSSGTFGFERRHISLHLSPSTGKEQTGRLSCLLPVLVLIHQTTVDSSQTGLLTRLRRRKAAPLMPIPTSIAKVPGSGVIGVPVGLVCVGEIL